MRKFRKGILLALTLSLVQAARSQHPINTENRELLSRFLEKTLDKVSNVEKKLADKSREFIRNAKKEEEKLKKKLSKIDSTTAKELFAETKSKYQQLEQQLANVNSATIPTGMSNYIAHLDTLKIALKYFNLDNLNKKLIDPELKNKIDLLKERIEAAESVLFQAKNIQQYLKERRMYLKQQFAMYGLEKHLKSLNKEVYYFAQTIRQYKEILKDPAKLEQKVIALVRELPAFKEFMKKNSMLASIFGVPSGNSSSSSLTGVQTRLSVQQYIQNSVPVNSSNPQQFLTQQTQYANSQMAKLKNTPKFMQFSEGLGEAPDFRPNSQKTKSFFKRLEYSANVQFGKINRMLPSTGEFAFGIGYKLNDKGIIGAGASYKLGLGNGIRDIRFSSQGYGLRAYVDWLIKSGIYVSGGYEKNFLPQLQNTTVAVRSGLFTAEHWQESGMIGVSKKYPINKKVNGTAQILFDFLSYKNIPKSQPVIFRIGWSF